MNQHECLEVTSCCADVVALYASKSFLSTINQHVDFQTINSDGWVATLHWFYLFGHFRSCWSMFVLTSLVILQERLYWTHEKSLYSVCISMVYVEFSVWSLITQPTQLWDNWRQQKQNSGELYRYSPIYHRQKILTMYVIHRRLDWCKI